MTVKDLAEEFEITRRQVYRDVDRIQDEGHPLEQSDGEGEKTWQLPLGYKGLPPIMLSPYELMSLQIARADLAYLNGTPFVDDLDHTLAKLRTTLPNKTVNHDPEKLEVALEVSEAVGVIRRKVPMEFWRIVRDMLDSKLKQHGNDVNWEVYMDDDVWASLSKLGLVWKVRKNGNLQFALLFENLAGRSAYYGIIRGKDISAESREEGDRTLSDDMTIQKRFLPSSGWPGYQYLSKLDLNQFVGDKKENILALHTDNLDEGHPLAGILVSLLWNLFENTALG